jgi:hypothetical protein
VVPFCCAISIALLPFLFFVVFQSPYQIFLAPSRRVAHLLFLPGTAFPVFGRFFVAFLRRIGGRTIEADFCFFGSYERRARVA